MIEILFENEYREKLEYIGRHNGGCGMDCEHCLVKTYTLKRKYLKAYIQKIWITEPENMPKLVWQNSTNAVFSKLGDYHSCKCRKNLKVKDCDCVIAKFFRVCFEDIDEDTIKPSLGTICQKLI